MLSVLMPNYNHARHLGQALSAILRQSEGPLEVIVVDDGSTDESVTLVEQFARLDSRVRLLTNGENRGAVPSLNRALGEARGDYVYGAAADDLVLPGFFRKALLMAKRYPEAGILCGQWLKVDFVGRELELGEVSRWREERYAAPEAFLSEYLESETPMHSLGFSTVYRKACLSDVGGFRSDLGHWCDTFAARAIGLRHGAAYVPEVFACWRSTGTGFAQSSLQDADAALAIVARAARLMRSPEFRDRFPAAHVTWWENGYRECVVRQRALSTR